MIDRATGEQLYPCSDCGVLRTKAEGGTVFTVCDDCWDKHHPPCESIGAKLLSATREQLSRTSTVQASSKAERQPPKGRIMITPRPFVLDPGEACWCNRGKDCDGNHEIYLDEPVHRCGFCGKTFEIKPDDPHWSTGRGPLCPTERT